ncbi:MAG: Ig-like domain-containing protein [Sulfolobales archaeon]
MYCYNFSSLPEGKHSLVVECINVKGTPTKSNERKFIIDTTPPTIKVYEQSKEFGREIPNGGVITSDKVEIVAEDLFGVSKIKVTAPSGRTYSENTTFNTRVLSGLYEYGEYIVFCEDKAGNKSDIFKFSRIRKEGLVVGMGDRDITPPIIMVGNTKGEFYRYPYVRVKLENDICVIRTMDEDSGIKMIIVKGINDSYYKNILVDVSSNV